MQLFIIRHSPGYANVALKIIIFKRRHVNKLFNYLLFNYLQLVSSKSDLAIAPPQILLRVKQTIHSRVFVSFISREFYFVNLIVNVCTTIEL